MHGRAPPVKTQHAVRDDDSGEDHADRVRRLDQRVYCRARGVLERIADGVADDGSPTVSSRVLAPRSSLVRQPELRPAGPPRRFATASDNRSCRSRELARCASPPKISNELPRGGLGLRLERARRLHPSLPALVQAPCIESHRLRSPRASCLSKSVALSTPTRACAATKALGHASTYCVSASARITSRK